MAMQKDITTEINRTAHTLAQQQYATYRQLLHDGGTKAPSRDISLAESSGDSRQSGLNYPLVTGR